MIKAFTRGLTTLFLHPLMTGRRSPISLEAQPCLPSPKDQSRTATRRKTLRRRYGADRFVSSGSVRSVYRFSVHDIYGIHGIMVGRLRCRATVRSLNQALVSNCWRNGTSPHPHQRTSQKPLPSPVLHGDVAIRSRSNMYHNLPLTGIMRTGRN